MGQRHRCDYPGSWHHVVNRGIAKRPLFEDRADVRYFLSRLAREVRRGRIEVHAYCVMTTHFHALVRSPIGELSEAMRRSQNEYSRFFNRRHKRDGTLVRGRFLSRAVDSLLYRRNVVRYIDRNPVKAGLVSCAWEYPWSSAAHYVRGRGPIWLERSWTEAWVRGGNGSGAFTPAGYRQVVGRRPTEGSMTVVEERLSAAQMANGEIDNLVHAAPRAVQRWMAKKAQLADGTRPGEPVCDANSIRLAVEAARNSVGEWRVAPNSRTMDGWAIAEAGLLRDLACLTIERASRVTGSSSSKVRRRVEIHRRLGGGGEYGQRVAELAAAALGNCYGVNTESY